jgi:RNA polymerase sigma factor (TIGR02999 family)
MNETPNVTQILKLVEEGDPSAAEALLPLVYEELRRVASEKLAQEKPGQTLQATALVHEAWLRLVDVDYVQHWSSRRYFFGAAAEAMRRILVDKTRRKNRQKHGADWQRITIPFEDVDAPVAADDSLLEALDEALQRFEQEDATACELVKLRYFAGLSLRDAAETLELAPRTADRLWAYAKAWLLREIRRDPTDSP